MSLPVKRPSAPSRYGPLVPAAVLMLLLLAILPSSLALPNANPSETLEYAPVPPEDDSIDTPPSGNLSALGLAQGRGVGSNAAAGEGPPDPVADLRTAGKNPRTKRCVGNPPRQTEDPSSPPCVAFFRGDNGGATYKGVTKDEVRVLFYFDGGYIQTSPSSDEQTLPADTYFDLAEPPKRAGEDPHTRALRAYQRYFNERYQAYGRFVHFYIYFGRGTASHNAEGRRADAYDNYQKIKPFAVFPLTQFFQPDPYLEVMAKFGVLNFGTFASRPQSFFQRFPKLIWGYRPSIEQYAKTFADYVCNKVVPYPVSFSGNADAGSPRKLGLIRTTDPVQPGMQQFAVEVRRLVTECGGNFVAEGTFPSAGYVHDARYTPEYATTAMAEFSQKGVTTVIWAQGWEKNFSAAAANIGYRPEWVIAGDGTHEANDRAANHQEQSVWRNAWVVTSMAVIPDRDRRHCYLAAREADPAYPPGDVSYACQHYENIRQLFIGIQVAGPRLTPDNIDRGFHAIPPVSSPDPQVPACYYEAGDYTCVKDAMVMWWDPAGRPGATNTPGCFRLPQGGRRFISGDWPPGDVPAQRDPGRDTCNIYTVGESFRSPT